MNNFILAGLVGHGIQASRTPRLHEAEGQAQGLQYTYHLHDLQTMQADCSVLPQLLAQFEAEGYTGINITHPCKQTIIPCLDELSPEATAIGAVNTVVFSGGKRIGHNTDWWGFAESFKRGLPDVQRQQVVLIGAGGAGAALAFAAYQLGVQTLSIYDTDTARAAQLALRCNQTCAPDFAVAVTDPATAIQSAQGVMQATPIGMIGHPGCPIPPAYLHSALWVAEVIYTPLETLLLQHAKALGCRILAGSGMTVFQAVKTFQLFTGRSADADRMTRHFHRM